MYARDNADKIADAAVVRQKWGNCRKREELITTKEIRSESASIFKNKQNFETTCLVINCIR